MPVRGRWATYASLSACRCVLYLTPLMLTRYEGTCLSPRQTSTMLARARHLLRVTGRARSRGRTVQSLACGLAVALSERTARSTRLPSKHTLSLVQSYGHSVVATATGVISIDGPVQCAVYLTSEGSSRPTPALGEWTRGLELGRRHSAAQALQTWIPSGSAAAPRPPCHCCGGSKWSRTSQVPHFVADPRQLQHRWSGVSWRGKAVLTRLRK